MQRNENNLEPILTRQQLTEPLKHLPDTAQDAKQTAVEQGRSGWHPKDFQSTRCDSPCSLETESLQDVSRSSNTDISIFSSKVGVSQPANKPDDRGFKNYPKWSLEEATPTPE